MRQNYDTQVESLTKKLALLEAANHEQLKSEAISQLEQKLKKSQEESELLRKQVKQITELQQSHLSAKTIAEREAGMCTFCKYQGTTQ
jgi:hypothetical protein